MSGDDTEGRVDQEPLEAVIRATPVKTRPLLDLEKLRASFESGPSRREPTIAERLLAIADAEMIAKLGYVVFAEDIFGKGIVPKSVPEMTELITIYNNDRPLMRARALAGFDVLKAQPMVDPTKLAAVGYCFGGTVGIELIETGAPLLGFVSVHGSFRNFAPEAAKNIKGRVLILHGSEDPVAPMDELNAVISQLRAAKVDFEVNLYSGTTHGFTHPQNPSEVRADEQYKVAMTRFLKDLLPH
jgi:dienelactone hydrolase